jgi:nucleotide-binding universal stress UspA family protein
MRILIPVDGSNASLRVIQNLIARRDLYAQPEALDIHILNVQQGLPGHVGRLVHADDIADYHREEGMKCLAAARNALDAASIKYTHHIAVGDPGQVIIQYVVELGCEEIRMGIHNRGALAEFFMGSVSTEVIKLTQVPVLLVP